MPLWHKGRSKAAMAPEPLENKTVIGHRVAELPQGVQTPLLEGTTPLGTVPPNAN